MKGRRLLLAAVVACIASPGFGAITARFNRKAGAIRKVCVLPVDAELTRVGMKGGASLQKESEEWAEKLQSTLKRAISDAGGDVTGVTLEDLQHDDDARQSVVRLRQKYAGIARLMRRKPGGVKTGRYTLGDEVSLVPCAGQADALAFVDATGLLQSGGRKAFDVLVGGVGGILLAQGRFDLWIALVDAKTGEITALVLDFSFGSRTAKNPEDALTKRLAEQFKKVHVGTTGP